MRESLWIVEYADKLKYVAGAVSFNSRIDALALFDKLVSAGYYHATLRNDDLDVCIYTWPVEWDA